jgi:hypothetical protein
MRSKAAAALLLALVTCLVSCASPARLARQSDEALAHGDLAKAYDKALRAIDKDPQNAAAREAYDAASLRVGADYRSRVLAAAVSDTLAAADLALEYRDFRLEVAHHGSAPGGAPAYEDAEPRILRAAARIRYRSGRAQMQAKHPRIAWREFGAALRYVPDFSDAARRKDAAWALSVSRVAVLPFTDGIGISGLPLEVEQGAAGQIARRIAKDFRFTQLVPADSVEQRLTLAQTRELSRDDARAIGRALGAGLVVSGHFLGMRSTDSSREPSLTVYHRVERHDDEGKTVVEWRPSPMSFVTRDRDVTVRWSFDVIDVRTGAVVLHREQDATAGARIAWTRFQPDEDCDHYALLPPDERTAHPDRAREVDAAWKERMGTWTLPEFLKSARGDRDRAHYSSRWRGEFRGDTRKHPVWMGELPGEGELAHVALEGAWKPLYDGLRELDKQE